MEPTTDSKMAATTGRLPEKERVNSQSQVLEFGEMVQFIPFKNESRTDKFDAKLREGVWVGLDSRTDEHIMGNMAYTGQQQ